MELKKKEGLLPSQNHVQICKPDKKFLAIEQEISQQDQLDTIIQKQQFQNATQNYYKSIVPSIAVIQASLYSVKKLNTVQFSRPALFCYQDITQPSIENVALTCATLKTECLEQIMNQKFDDYQTKVNQIIQMKFGQISKFLDRDKQFLNNELSEEAKLSEKTYLCQQVRNHAQLIYQRLMQDSLCEFIIARIQTGNFIKKYSFQIFEPKSMSVIFTAKPCENQYNIFLQSIPHRKVGYLSGNFFKTEFILKAVQQQNRVQKKQATITYDFCPFSMSQFQRIQMHLHHHKQNKQQASKQYFCSKQPRWNSQIKKYILDFPNKKAMISKKNFILTKKNCKNKTPIASVCKFRRNLYHLEIRSPLSIFQGIGLAISNLDKMI